MQIVSSCLKKHACGLIGSQDSKRALLIPPFLRSHPSLLHTRDKPNRKEFLQMECRGQCHPQDHL